MPGRFRTYPRMNVIKARFPSLSLLSAEKLENLGYNLKIIEKHGLNWVNLEFIATSQVTPDELQTAMKLYKLRELRKNNLFFDTVEINERMQMIIHEIMGLNLQNSPSTFQCALL